MHRIDLKRLGILGFVNRLIELQINVLLLVRQSASTIVIHICFMGLQNVSKIQWITCENHKCEHFDYETNDEYECMRKRSKTTPTSSESVHDVRLAPASSVPMRTKDLPIKLKS